MATGIGILVLALRPGVSTIQAPTAPTPTQDTPPTPWQRVQDWWEEYWLSGIWIPVIVGVVMIDTMIWKLWPKWLSEHWEKNWGWILLLHLFYIAGISMFPTNRVWKVRTAKILITGTIITLLSIFGITPWVGENWWAERAEAAKKAQDAIVAAQEKIEEARLQKPLILDRIVTAPANGWSEEIDTRNGARVRPDGPIIIMIDDGSQYEDDKGHRVPKHPPTTWMKFKSRTDKDMSVPIYKW